MSWVGDECELIIRGVQSHSSIVRLLSYLKGEVVFRPVSDAQSQARFRQLQWLWSHTSVLTILLVGSVGLNVLLARRVSNINALLQVKLRYPVLAPGSQAPTFSAKDLNGKPVILNYGENGLPTVLYIFSPDCHYCAQNLENIRFLASNLGGKYRFVGVSMTTDKLSEYLAQNSMPFQIYHSPPDTVRLAYDFRATPSTIVVSNEGKILQYWQGAYGKELQSQVERFFQLRLPGLTKV